MSKIGHVGKHVGFFAGTVACGGATVVGAGVTGVLGLTTAVLFLTTGVTLGITSPFFVLSALATIGAGGVTALAAKGTIECGEEAFTCHN